MNAAAAALRARLRPELRRETLRRLSSAVVLLSFGLMLTLVPIGAAGNGNGNGNGGGGGGSTQSPPPGQTAPSNTSPPTISGSAVAGQTLTATTGAWTGSGSFTYQWQRCDASGNGCGGIGGATGGSYSLGGADVGFTVRVSVTETNKNGSASATSGATSIVAAAPAPTPVSAPTDTALPSISGSALVSQVLSASTGTWTASPTAYAYQWRRCDSTGASCAAVSGATSSSYTVATGDVGSTLRVAVTASNSGGSSTAVSAQTGAVTSSSPTPSSTPSSSYPASFFTGPLGAKEILPTNPNGALFGLWYGEAGSSVLTTRTVIQQRIADLGRTPDFIGAQLDQLTANGVTTEAWIHSLHSIPVISWNPTGYTTAQIAGGALDSTFVSLANRFKAEPFRIMFRTFIEFDLPTNAYSMGTTSQDAANFRAAWQRMVNIFQANGATNVGFWWCPGEQGNSTTRAQITASYPGDQYVDWVGSDAYNNDSNAWSTPWHAGWAEFNEIFNYGVGSGVSQPMWKQWGTEKPFVIGETGSKYDTPNVPSGHVVDPSRKANWFLNISSVAHPATAGGILGMEFFDQWASSEGNDWHVDHNQPAGTSVEGTSDSTTYQGFKSLAAASWLNVGAVGGAS